jgi:hypothetical protein
MSDQAAPEPTMEEILASIRRIISEDDGPAEAEAGPEHAPEHASEPAPEPANEPHQAFEPAPEPPAEDVLELTDRVPSETETVGDIEAYTKAEPEPAPEPEPVPLPPIPKPSATVHDDDRLVSEPSASAAALAFGSLSEAIAMPAAGRTLEDLVRELMRPLLRAWLDENLPRIVEAKVAEEVERIARSRVR